MGSVALIWFAQCFPIYKTHSCPKFICSVNTNENQFQLTLIRACGVHKPSTIVYKQLAQRISTSVEVLSLPHDRIEVPIWIFRRKITVLLPTKAYYLDSVLP